jgi:hypothetical protein
MSNEQKNNTNSENSRQAADALNKDIEFFFLYTPHPTECNRRPLGQYSTLHLLRQDIIYCFNQGSAIWPATMAIFAGIDLLAKYYKGDDRGGVAERFKKFIEDYLYLSEQSDRDVIWQLRNSMLHSFGLYSEDRKDGKVKAYKFKLVRYTSRLIQEGDTEQIEIRTEKYPLTYYTVDVSILQQEFERGIRQYHNHLRDEQKTGLREKFKKIYELKRYNGVKIG